MKKALFIIVVAILIIPGFFYSNTNNNKTTDENTTKKAITDDNISDDITIDIKGAVQKPGVYTLQNGSIVNDAINIAGGVTNGTTQCINMARVLNNEDLIIIPETCEQSNIININTDGAQMLTLLPGIGETRANDIIEYRTENGNFNKTEDIMNVTGIGESTYLKIKDSITI